MRESSEASVCLQSLTSSALESILEFIYGGMLSLTEDNLEEILAAASYLQVDWVLKCCCAFMKSTLSGHNCAEYIRMVQFYALHTVVGGKCAKLLQGIHTFVMEQILEVYKAGEHKKLPYESLKEYVNSDKFQVSEVVLFEVVKDWLEASPENEKYSVELLSDIRYKLLPVSELKKLLKLPLIRKKSLEPIKLLIKDSIQYLSESIWNRLKREALSSSVSAAPTVRGGPSILAFAGFHRSTLIHDRTLSNGMHALMKHKNKKVWVELPNVPHTFYGSSVVCTKGFVFVCGGWRSRDRNAPATRVCHVFDPLNWKWAKIPPLMYARADFSLLVHQGSLYALGGRQILQNADSALGSIERYSWEDQAWRVVAHLHQPTYNLKAASLNECIYIYGGQGSQGSELDTFFSYNPDKEPHEQLEELLAAAESHYDSSCNMVISQGHVCLTVPGKCHYTRYDPGRSTWLTEHVGKHPLFSFYGSVVTNDDKVYCIGGVNNQVGHRCICIKDMTLGSDYKVDYLPKLPNQVCSPLVVAVPIPYFRLEEARQKAQKTKEQEEATSTSWWHK